MKRILITNDDGIFAAGIFELAKQLSRDYEVYIVAPAAQKSGASHSITLRETLYLNEVTIPGLENVKAYSLTGTPADCVKFAVGTLKLNPDIIASGINLGANLGTDVLYSGTLGAAVEAVIMGYPAVALSVVSHNASYVADAAKACKEAVDFYADNTSVCKLLSVNVPNLPYDEIKGVALTNLSKRNYPSEYELQEDGGYRMPSWGFDLEKTEKGCDEYMVCQGYVTWSPILTERFSAAEFPNLKSAFEKWRKRI